MPHFTHLAVKKVKPWKPMSWLTLLVPEGQEGLVVPEGLVLQAEGLEVLEDLEGLEGPESPRAQALGWDPQASAQELWAGASGWDPAALDWDPQASAQDWTHNPLGQPRLLPPPIL